MAQNPPTQPPTPPAPAAEDQIILVRGSEEYQEYMRHQGGWLKMLVAQFESNLATAGRILLLLFLIYTTIKTGLDRMGVATPIWLEIIMLALQVGGVEGAVPGLSRQKEELLSQNKQNEAKEISGAITSTRWLALLTGCEIGLDEIAAKAGTSAPPWLAWLVLGYSIVLLLARLWLITKFLIAMSRIEHKGPRIISKAEHERQQKEKGQKQIRLDNASIQATIAQAIEIWTKAQEQRLTDWSQRLQQQLQSDLTQTFGAQLHTLAEEQARMLTAIQQVQTTPASVPPIDTQAIIAGVVTQFEGRFTHSMKRLEAEVKQQVLVSLASERGTMKQEDETLAGPRLVSLPQRSTSTRTRQTDEQKAVQPGTRQESSESGDCKSAVYALLDQDNTKQPADLARLTGYPRTTVWRWWNRYHEEHGTRGLAGIVAGSSESQAEAEFA